MGTQQSDNVGGDSGQESETTVSFEFDPTGENIIVEIIEAISAATGEDPMGLPPLGAVIDPDALEACIRSGNETVEISFVFEDRQVTVAASGSGTIQQLQSS